MELIELMTATIATKLYSHQDKLGIWASVTVYRQSLSGPL